MSETSAQPNNLVGATLAGKYTLTGLLGEGAMGAVYEAITPEGRVVAVKTLLAAARQQLGQEALSRFVREAQVSAAVKDPHVVEVIDAGHDESSDVAFMVMEVLRGEDLEQLLVCTGALRPEVWERWLRWDPVRMAPAHAEALRSMRAIWIDAGTRDEWFLDLGALAFREAVRQAGVPEDTVRFELFEAGHMAIEYRHPQALAWLAHRLAP